MAEKLDELAKSLAAEEDLPRRRMLGRVAAVMGGGLAAVFAGQRSAAAAPPVKCPLGLTNCDGVCRYTAVNADHCGRAATHVPPVRCAAAACASPVPAPSRAPRGRRAAAARASTSAPTHCGRCTTVCGSGQVCANGQCAAGCPSGQTNCGGECVDLQTDPQHCGACNQKCLGFGPCISTVCQNGQCTHIEITGACEDNNPGSDGICDVKMGNCSFVPVANGTPCPNGTCQSGTCVATGGAANGQACSTSSQCASGICANGICCNSPCDGACATCGTGTCTPRPATTVCRAQSGPCDVAEVCDGVSLTCPPDEVAGEGTACPGGDCNGVSVVCQSGPAP